MKKLLPLALIGVGLLAGCPGPDGNPPVLWLAPNGSEIVIQLLDHEPPPW